MGLQQPPVSLEIFQVSLGKYFNFPLPGRRLLHPHDGAGLDVLTPDLGRVVPDDEEVLGVEGVPLHLRYPGSLGRGEGRYWSLIGQYYILLFSRRSI